MALFAPADFTPCPQRASTCASRPQRASTCASCRPAEGLFANCFPNILDTTAHYSEDDGGNPDTFVYTGDIPAMWLRDSGAQVWPYVSLTSEDAHLQQMLKGVILRQLRCISIDPYANAFNQGPTGSEWQSDRSP